LPSFGRLEICLNRFSAPLLPNTQEELARLYHIPIPKQTDLPISYNIAPSQKVLAIRFNPETQQRPLDALQWGLMPHWTKDSKIAYRTINARAETVDKAPSFRQAFIKRRCSIPADGFYEWRKTAKPKLPFAIAMKDGRPFTFAGLWENWKDPESGEWLRTCTIITGEPNELVAQIHPKMPVILPQATSRGLARGNRRWKLKSVIGPLS
jgi:putative SOS response-associated peptidase YedK